LRNAAFEAGLVQQPNASPADRQGSSRRLDPLVLQQALQRQGSFSLSIEKEQPILMATLGSLTLISSSTTHSDCCI
jgi:hypothetical protein